MRLHTHLLVAVHLGLQACITCTACVTQCAWSQRTPAPLWGVKGVLALWVAAHAPRGPDRPRHDNLMVHRGHTLGHFKACMGLLGVWLGYLDLPVGEGTNEGVSTNKRRRVLQPASAKAVNQQDVSTNDCLLALDWQLLTSTLLGNDTHASTSAGSISISSFIQAGFLALRFVRDSSDMVGKRADQTAILHPAMVYNTPCA